MRFKFLVIVLFAYACESAITASSSDLGSLVDQDLLQAHPILDAELMISSQKDQNMAISRDQNIMMPPRDAMISPIDSDQQINPQDPQNPQNPQNPQCMGDDLDHDGFSGSELCAQRDCDDHNPSISPRSAESCNGLDDDCDGNIDENLLTRRCGVGACRVQVPVCVNGQISRCDPLPPQEELCDQIDNDCDGRVDEISQMTIRCGVGLCENIVPACSGRCDPLPPLPEECDGFDNNCNGVVDEGFQSHIEETSFSELVQIHNGCNGTEGNGRFSPDCNAAIHRLCMDGCSNTGFGFTENSGDWAAVICMKGNDVVATVDQLHNMHDGCRSDNRLSIYCNSARHRFCTQQGFVSGFGPVENAANEQTVSCIPFGSIQSFSYDELRNKHADCRPDQPSNPCNAAINRACADRGFISGFGPVELSNNTAFVICVNP